MYKSASERVSVTVLLATQCGCHHGTAGRTASNPDHAWRSRGITDRLHNSGEMFYQYRLSKSCLCILGSHDLLET